MEEARVARRQASIDSRLAALDGHIWIEEVDEETNLDIESASTAGRPLCCRRAPDRTAGAISTSGTPARAS